MVFRNDHHFPRRLENLLADEEEEEILDDQEVDLDAMVVVAACNATQ